jgi:hypothetical protein
VREAVKEFLTDWPGVEVITQGRNSVEPEAGITIILLSRENLPPEFDQGLTKAVHQARGDKPVVRIFPLLSARQYPPQ